MLPVISIHSSTLIWSSVNVPVLSVQSISIDPKFWIAPIFFTTVLCLAIFKAPLVRFSDTIAGNISGVKPTASDAAKVNASKKLPVWYQSMTRTRGTITAINIKSILETFLTLLSNSVSGSASCNEDCIAPKYVFWPVPITTAIAVPLTTLVPRRQTFV